MLYGYIAMLLYGYYVVILSCSCVLMLLYSYVVIWLYVDIHTQTMYTFVQELGPRGHLVILDVINVFDPLGSSSSSRCYS